MEFTDKFICGKGWMLSQDEQGNIAPFFLQVRSDDVHSSDSTLYNDTICNILKEYHHETKIDVGSVMNLNDLSVKLRGDNTYEAKGRIPIVSNKSKLYDNIFNGGPKQGFLIIAPLPFHTIFDSTLNIQVTMCGIATAFATSSITVVPMLFTQVGTSRKYDIKKAYYNYDTNMIGVYITSTATIDPSNVINNNDYKNSFISISICGTVDDTTSISNIIPENIDFTDVNNVDSLDLKLGYYPDRS